jgi:hypothetical protein
VPRSIAKKIILTGLAALTNRNTVERCGGVVERQRRKPLVASLVNTKYEKKTKMKRRTS